MLEDSLQIFEVNNRMQFEGEDITLDGYSKHKSIYFGLIVLNEDGTPSNCEDFVILGSLPEKIVYVKSIAIDRSNGKLGITIIGVDEVNDVTTTIVPKGSKMLDVEVFFRTPTFITNNNIKIKGGM